MKTIKYAYKKYPIGIIKIGYFDDYLVSLTIVYEMSTSSESAFSNQVFKELDEYFNGIRKEFTVNISLEGTDFQKKVWNKLINIPYGTTKSYQEIAEDIGHNKAYRAVGNANNKNKIAIIVPCHRVINANNKLGGYAFGLDMKTKLLELERKNS